MKGEQMPKITPQIDSYKTLAAINGMIYTHKGIQGRIEIDCVGGMTRVNHVPTAKGRKTDAYRETRRDLGDDWVTCWEGDAPLKFWATVERRGYLRFKS